MEGLVAPADKVGARQPIRGSQVFIPIFQAETQADYLRFVLLLFYVFSVFLRCDHVKHDFYHQSFLRPASGSRVFGDDFVDTGLFPVYDRGHDYLKH